jgi:hypothetical protein
MQQDKTLVVNSAIKHHLKLCRQEVERRPAQVDRGSCLEEQS